MISTISKTLRQWVATAFIFMGLAIIILGGLIVRLGAWLGNRQVVDVENDYDISDDQLAQVIKEAEEARRNEK